MVRWNRWREARLSLLNVATATGEVEELRWRSSVQLVAWGPSKEIEEEVVGSLQFREEGHWNERRTF